MTFNANDLPPHQRAELEMLRGMYALPDVRRGAALGLDEILFTHPSFKKAFKLLVNLKDDEAINPTMVNATAQKIGLPLDNYNFLVGEFPEKTILQSHFRTIRDLGGRQALIEKLEEGLSALKNPTKSASEIAERVREGLYHLQIASTPLTEFNTSTKDLVNRAIKTIEELHERKDKTSTLGLSTGFRDLDKWTSGLHPGIILIASRPYLPLSNFALSITLHAAVNEKLRAMYVTGNSSEDTLILDSLTMLAKVSKMTILDRFCTESEFRRLVAAAGKLNNSKIIFHDKLRTPEEIYRQVSYEKNKHGLDLLVVDKLVDFIAPSSNLSANDLQMKEHAVHTARILKRIALDHNLPIITLAEIGKEADRRIRSKRPRIGDIREYGALEYLANPIIILHKEEDEEGEENLDMVPVVPVSAYLHNNKKGTGLNGQIKFNYNERTRVFESAGEIDSESD